MASGAQAVRKDRECRPCSQAESEVLESERNVPTGPKAAVIDEAGPGRGARE